MWYRQAISLPSHAIPPGSGCDPHEAVFSFRGV